MPIARLHSMHYSTSDQQILNNSHFTFRSRNKCCTGPTSQQLAALHVDNLPVNSSEYRPRTLFSRCVEYLQLCFRTMFNGPMSFTKFEDVGCVTQDLNVGCGKPLSNLVKGVIQLSLSKRPVGARL